MPALDNQRHETFVLALFEGDSQRQAYIKAFPRAANWKESTVDSKACVLAKDGKVLERYKELQDEASESAVIGKIERMLILTDIATDVTKFAKERMQAIDILNKMDGDYVKKIEATVTTDVSKVAAEIGAILDE